MRQRYVSTYPRDIGKHAIRSSEDKPGEEEPENRIGSLCTGHHILLSSTTTDEHGDTWAVIDAASLERGLIEPWVEEEEDAGADDDVEGGEEGITLSPGSARRLAAARAAALEKLRSCFAQQAASGNANVFICVSKSEASQPFLVLAEDASGSGSEEEEMAATEESSVAAAAVDTSAADLSMLSDLPHGDEIHETDAIDIDSAEFDDMTEDGVDLDASISGLDISLDASIDLEEDEGPPDTDEEVEEEEESDGELYPGEREEDEDEAAVQTAEAVSLDGDADEVADDAASVDAAAVVEEEEAPEEAVEAPSVEATAAAEQPEQEQPEQEPAAADAEPAAAAQEESLPAAAAPTNAVSAMVAKASGAYDLDALEAANPFGAAAPEEAEESDKPWNELIVSKAWKERRRGYAELAACLSQDDADADADADATATMATCLPLLKGMAKERMAGAQSDGYRAITAYFARSESGTTESSDVSAVASELVTKGLLSRSTSQAQDALLAMIRCGSSANLGTSLIKSGLKSRNTKLVDAALAFVLRIFREVEGKNTADLKDALNAPLLKALDTHKLPGVRVKAKELRVLLEGTPLGGGPAATSAGSSSGSSASSSGGSGAAASGTAVSAALPVTAPLQDRIRAIFKRQKTTFGEKLKAKKWSERNDALKVVITLVGKTPTLPDGEYDSIVRALVAIVVKDGNVAVTISATHLLTAITRGVEGRHFSHPARAILVGILKRMKERKASVRNALGEALDALVETKSLVFTDDLSTKVLEAATNSKQPKVQRGIVDWMHRCVAEGSAAQPAVFADSDTFTVFLKVFEQSLDAREGEVRTAGAEGLTIMWSNEGVSTSGEGKASRTRCGDRVAAMIAPAERRSSSIATASSSSTTAEASAAPAAAAAKTSSTTAPVAAAATASSTDAPTSASSPAASASASASASTASASSAPHGIVVSSTVEEAEEQLASLGVAEWKVKAKTLAAADASWQDKCAVMDEIAAQLVEIGEGPAAVFAEPIVSLLSAHFKKFKVRNFNLMKRIILVLAAVAKSRTAFSVTRQMITPAVENCGDKRLGADAQSLLLQLCRTSEVRRIVEVAVGLFEKERAASKLEAFFTFACNAVEEFGAAKVGLKFIVKYTVGDKGMGHKTPKLRNAALNLLGVVFHKIGPKPMDALLKGAETGAGFMKTASKKFEEVGFDTAAVAAFTSDPDASDCVAAAVDLATVKGLGKLLELMGERAGKNAWKERVKGLEALQKILNANPSIVLNKAAAKVCRSLKALVTDAMPRVKTVAAVTIALFASAFDPQVLRRFNRIMLDDLLDTLVDTKPMVVAAGQTALSAWVGIAPAGGDSATADPVALAAACAYFSKALTRHPTHGRKLLLEWFILHVSLCVTAGDVFKSDLMQLVPSLVNCMTDRAHEVREGAIAVLVQIVTITGISLVTSTARDMPKATQLGMRKGLDRVSDAAAGVVSSSDVGGDASSAKVKAVTSSPSRKSSKAGLAAHRAAKAGGKGKTAKSGKASSTTVAATTTTTTGAPPSTRRSSTSAPRRSSTRKASTSTTTASPSRKASTDADGPTTCLVAATSKRAREKRFRKLGWNWDKSAESPSSDLEAAVRDELEKCTSADPALCKQLFSTNFNKQSAGIKALKAAVEAQPSVADQVLDVPLMWCIIRLYQRETTSVTTALLSLLQSLFLTAAAARSGGSESADADGSALALLSPFETELFFPYFIEKSGHKIERLRKTFEEITVQLRSGSLIASEHMVAMLIEGIRTKNTKTAVFCLHQMHAIAVEIAPDAPAVMREQGRRFVKVIALAICGRDEGQRKAALDLVEEVWQQQDCDTPALFAWFKSSGAEYMRDAKVCTLIEERLKRSKFRSVAEGAAGGASSAPTAPPRVKRVSKTQSTPPRAAKTQARRPSSSQPRSGKKSGSVVAARLAAFREANLFELCAATRELTTLSRLLSLVTSFAAPSGDGDLRAVVKAFAELDGELEERADEVSDAVDIAQDVVNACLYSAQLAIIAVRNPAAVAKAALEQAGHAVGIIGDATLVFDHACIKTIFTLSLALSSAPTVKPPLRPLRRSAAKRGSAMDTISAALQAISECDVEADLERGVTDLQKVIDDKLGKLSPEGGSASDEHASEARRIFRDVFTMYTAGQSASTMQRNIAGEVLVKVFGYRGYVKAEADIISELSVDAEDSAAGQLLELASEWIEDYDYTPPAPVAVEVPVEIAPPSPPAEAEAEPVELLSTPAKKVSEALSSEAMEELDQIFSAIASVPASECGSSDPRIVRLATFLEEHNKRLGELHELHQMSPAFQGWLESHLEKSLSAMQSAAITAPTDADGATYDALQTAYEANEVSLHPFFFPLECDQTSYILSLTTTTLMIAPPLSLLQKELAAGGNAGSPGSKKENSISPIKVNATPKAKKSSVKKTKRSAKKSASPKAKAKTVTPMLGGSGGTSSDAPPSTPAATAKKSTPLKAKKTSAKKTSAKKKSAKKKSAKKSNADRLAALHAKFGGRKKKKTSTL